MRTLTVLFSLAILAGVVLVLPIGGGQDMLIAAQSVSPTMPATLG
ncbi:hypothetical protein [Brevundimonas sp. AAP58]|nr:hypothetical protein [Brevundimonas sp. AAP58]